MFERKVLAVGESVDRQLLSHRSLRGADNVVRPFQARPAAVAKQASGGTLLHFGRAIADLAACTRCFVSTVPGATELLPESIRIGHVAEAVSAATLVQMASKTATSSSVFPFLKSDDPVAAHVIGRPNGNGSHSIIGQWMVRNQTNVVFAAGWRKNPFFASEIAWLARAIPVIWSTAEARLQQQSTLLPVRTFLEQMLSPAFVVDEGLRLHETNGRGRRLLAEGMLLRADHGLLVGASAAVTESLKDIARNLTLSRVERRLVDATVPLTADGRRLAFAWVGALPIPHEAGQMLVIVPGIDAAAGARRIAATFALNCVDEKIIMRILYGHCPRRIGADLGLTEATIRTYTKRIMLKLGINRQSELFLLYILTSSPFSGAEAVG